MTAKEPLVSVIMNCFNGETYLREAVESVVQQTYQNWELIFWDNRSSDHSAVIFRSFTDKRFKYFSAPEHTPLYAARNYAIAKSTGTLIAFLDVDDIWQERKLERQVPLFDDDEVGLVCSNYWIKEELLADGSFTKRLAIKKGSSGYVANKLSRNYFVGLLTAIVRRESYLALGHPFDPRFNIIGDFDLFFRISLHWKLVYQSEPLATYRLHENNLTKRVALNHVNEIDLWLRESVEKNIFDGRDFGLTMFARLSYTKIVLLKLAGNNSSAFVAWRKLPLGYWKVRGFILLITPNWLIRFSRK